ncbi:MAG: response regulator [Cyclobacteriaceae bacterium]|nr:response regulator [Cyclobacteriaceae bacterium]
MKGIFDRMLSARVTEKPSKDEQQAETGEHGLQKPISILIAEDNDINMMLIKSIFENILPQVKLVEAKNGVQAVDQFKKENPDFVFMDIRMPEKNGYEATAEMRQLEDKRRVPIIGLTAGTGKGDRDRCLEAGMDDYVSKPVVQDAIVKIMQKWLSLNMTPQDLLATNPKLHYDEQTLRARLQISEEVLQKILNTSTEEIDRCLAELRLHQASHDYKALRETAHRLSGVALNACFNVLADMAKKIEELSIHDHILLDNHIHDMATEIALLKRTI